MAALSRGRWRNPAKTGSTPRHINAPIAGKTYCFGNEAAKAEFMKDPEGNLATAQAYYSKKHPG